MDSFELNKIIGAVLGSMMLAMVSGIVAGILVKPKPLATPAYVVAAAEPAKPVAAPGAKPGAKEAAAAPAAAASGAKPPAAGSAPAGAEPIGPLLAAADVEAGKTVAKKCVQCHTFDKGGPNRIGPNLFGILGEPIAQGKGYQFSPALTAHKGEWTPDTLNQWLTSPKDFAKGTKMTFVGLSQAKDRADVIAYLNSLSDSPKPLRQ